MSLIFYNVNGSSLMKDLSLEAEQKQLDDAINKTGLGFEYLNYENLTKFVHLLELRFPGLVKVYSVGTSLEKRELWAMKITNTHKRPLGKPMFKYVANMHGDETVGRQMLIRLAWHLVSNYDKNTRITHIVDTIETHLLFSMNPDGFERAKLGDCDGISKNSGRENSNGVDLNRDFPDQFSDPPKGSVSVDEVARGRQPETVAVMAWIVSNPFVLSANLHGGSVVASYPFDSSPSHKETGEISLSPDNNVFTHLASLYASHHETMKTGQVCKDDDFINGTTNGAFWFDVPDENILLTLLFYLFRWYYVWSNCYEITLELSCCKYPPASQLPSEWNLNQESLLTFMEQTHMGIKGLIKNAVTNKPVERAFVKIQGIDHNVTTNARGEFWRLAVDGIYNITVEAYGYQPKTLTGIEIRNDQNLVNNSAKWIKVELEPTSNNADVSANSVVESDIVDIDSRRPSKPINSTFPEDFVTPYRFVHHNYTEMTKFLHHFAYKYPTLTRLYSIGKSVEGRELWVLEITDNPGVHEPGEPEFKYIANIHGNEVVGKELMLPLIQKLLENYEKDPKIKNLVDNIRIHILPSLNPDGYERSIEGDCESLQGRENANQQDLNRNFPDQFKPFVKVHYQPETEAVMHWIQSYPFVLSASLHGGSLVANYPYDGNLEEKDHVYSKSPDDDVFKHLALLYSYKHKTMSDGHPCKGQCGPALEFFENGVTNGASWYILYGGMQDFNYITTNCFEITLELGCQKFPYASDLPRYWDDNRVALIAFMEEVLRGIKGFVIDSDSAKPIPKATIHIEGINHDVKSAEDGDYWRLLTPGHYTITVSADGYESKSVSVDVSEGWASVVNVTLTKPNHKVKGKPLPINLSKEVFGKTVDTSGNPISGALIKVLNDESKVVMSNDDGKFKIPYSEGSYTFLVEAPGYFNTTKLVVFRNGQNSEVIIDLIRDNRIFGFPRSVFVIVCGSFILSLLITIMCAYNFALSKKYDKYKFQRLGESTSLFDDDDSGFKNGADAREFIDATSETDSEDELYNVHLWKEKDRAS
uniref:Peptidase M14 domain-containing protein n=1 Tax=Tetranychus urticae TaxID=32264 RepID=T1L0V9_TETUR